MKKTPLTLALLASTIFLTACTDDGDNGQNGLNSLIQQMPLVLGNDDCWSAGTRIESGLDKNQNGELDANEIQQSSIQCGPNLFAQGVALPYQNLTSFKANGTTIASAFTLRQGGALALMLLPILRTINNFTQSQIVAQMLTIMMA